MSRDQRLRHLLKELDHLGVEVRLDNPDLRVKHGDNLTAELCDEIAELRPELIEYLGTHGESIVDDDAVVTNSTPPAPEMNAEQKILAATKAAPRLYQNGEVLVNSEQGQRYGYFIKKLARERERLRAIENGDAPRQGFYKTGWDLFNRREYE